MHYLTLFVILLISNQVFSDSIVKSLCDYPEISAADRMVNGSVRVYRGKFYWELTDMTTTAPKMTGPYSSWWENFEPIYSEVATITALSGSIKGQHFKIAENKMWSWLENGKQQTGGKDGVDFPVDIVSGYHDESLGTGKPMIVGFKNDKVYYFDASTDKLTSIGSTDGYTGGQFEENFPQQISAAFSLPSSDSENKYFVYLFKRDQFCFRPWKATKDCDQWRDNRQLFGCPGFSATGQPEPGPPGSGQSEGGEQEMGARQAGDLTPPPNLAEWLTTPKSGSHKMCPINTAIVLIALYLKIKFSYYFSF